MDTLSAQRTVRRPKQRFVLKIDFFPDDYSSNMDYYIDLLEDAAKYKLMVNFHGATIPRGCDAV